MSRISNCFQEKNSPRLVTFIMTGDPNVKTTLELLHSFQKSGVAMVELGFPYSDPLADGPVIQRAALRALKNKLTMTSYFDFVKKARSEGITIPFIFFGYFNPVLQYGVDKFFQDAADAGIDGAIIPDLPYEESLIYRHQAEESGIDLIPLVAPTSGDRIPMIVENAKGFVYCVSSLGVTGTRNQFGEGIQSFLAEVKNHSRIPVGVGFGISSGDHVRHFSEMVDCVIVGSALIQVIESSTPDTIRNKVETFIHSLLSKTTVS